MAENLICGSEKAQCIACLSNAAVEHRKATSLGSYLPGTEAGEYAAQFYADMITEGERRGGVKGFFMEAGGWTGGLFASLWTGETAISTTITLATAGLGPAAAAGRLGAASVPIANTFKVIGSLQGGLSTGQAITGVGLDGSKLSTGERIVHGIAGALTFLSFMGQPNSALFRQSRNGSGPGFFNKGATRIGWSFRGRNLPGGGKSYFAFHGGGTYRGVNQGPHWHIYLNHFWPSGPSAAPVAISALINSFKAFGVIASGAYGYEIGNQYLNEKK